MSTFRSYVNKSNTLVKFNLTNSSQNPVTEITYGTSDKQLTRFIFDIDLSELKSRIDSGLINQDSILTHKLSFTNTINKSPELIGGKSYSETIERAVSFDLEFFNVVEDWDEGGGYDLVFDKVISPYNNVNIDPSNWYENKTNTLWANDGAYYTGSTILTEQHFDSGNENIDVDITDYVNYRLFGTGYTGTTNFSGNTYGLGIKFKNEFEDKITTNRKSVAFHTDKTNTYFLPYVETKINDHIVDDRNYFFLNKNNKLFLFVNEGFEYKDIDIKYVYIVDYLDNVYETITGTSVNRLSKGIYYINLNINQSSYPDNVIFRDVWHLDIDGREVIQSNDFYLINQNNYLGFNNIKPINFDNYYFNFWGILNNEKITKGDVKKIFFDYRKLYESQDEFIPINLEYRIFTNINSVNQINIADYTRVNRIEDQHYIDLDTYWLVPNEYYLQIRLTHGRYNKEMEFVKFYVVE